VTAVTPLHLGFRFLLELSLVAGVAYWGWHAGTGGAKGLLFAGLLTAAFAGVWGIFGTPGDPSRGTPPIAIPGWTRLLLELLLIGLGSYGVWTSWSRAAAETLLTLFVLQYALTWERSRWLLRAPANPRKE
jgi:hypothetical protein